MSRIDELQKEATALQVTSSLLGPLSAVVTPLLAAGIGRHEKDQQSRAKRADLGLPSKASYSELKAARKKRAYDAPSNLGGWCATQDHPEWARARRIGEQCPAGTIGFADAQDIIPVDSQGNELDLSIVPFLYNTAVEWVPASGSAPLARTTQSPPALVPLGPAAAPSPRSSMDWSNILGAVGGLGDLLGVPGLSSVSKVATSIVGAVRPTGASAPGPQIINLVSPPTQMGPMVEQLPARRAVQPKLQPVPRVPGAPRATAVQGRVMYNVKEEIPPGALDDPDWLKAPMFSPWVQKTRTLEAGPGHVNPELPIGGQMPQYGPSYSLQLQRHMGGAYANDAQGNPVCFPGWKLTMGRNGVIQCVRRRHMNPFNPRALARAARRVQSFSRHVKKYVKLTHPGRTVHVNPFKARRRKKCCK